MKGASAGRFARPGTDQGGRDRVVRGARGNTPRTPPITRFEHSYRRSWESGGLIGADAHFLLRRTSPGRRQERMRPLRQGRLTLSVLHDWIHNHGFSCITRVWGGFHQATVWGPGGIGVSRSGSLRGKTFRHARTGRGRGGRLGFAARRLGRRLGLCGNQNTSGPSRSSAGSTSPPKTEGRLRCVTSHTTPCRTGLTVPGT